METQLARQKKVTPIAIAMDHTSIPQRAMIMKDIVERSSRKLLWQRPSPGLATTSVSHLLVKMTVRISIGL